MSAALTALTPHLEVLPGPQQALWPELRDVPRGFVLYGGTALALRLGHRHSVDFDFFSSEPLDHSRLRRRLPFLATAETLQEEADVLTVSVARGGPVKVSLFGPSGFGRVGTPQRTADGVLTVASLVDLAATKVKVLLQRVEAKDYLDVAAILRSGVTLAEMLGGASTLFGPAFNPLSAQKTLAYFEAGDLAAVDASTRALLRAEAVRPVEVIPLPRTGDQLDAR
jgi:hypothetical protein